MAELAHLSEAQKAVLLLNKGLSPRASALRGDPDYRQLLALVALWSEGQRFPQESFGLAQLRGKEAAVAAPDAA